MSSLVLCLHPSSTYLKPKRVGIQIPQAIPSKLFTCPFLPIICTQLSIFKELFLSFHPICHQARLLGGPVLCVPPIVYYLFAMHLIFILQSSHLDEDKKNPQPHLHENPQCGADDKPKTTSETGHFTQEDKNTFNCALLFNTVFILCILLYRIWNGGNKLFVFVFVFVFLYIRKENLGVFSYLSRDTKLSTARLIIVQNRNFSI